MRKGGKGSVHSFCWAAAAETMTASADTVCNKSFRLTLLLRLRIHVDNRCVTVRLTAWLQSSPIGPHPSRKLSSLEKCLQFLIRLIGNFLGKKVATRESFAADVRCALTPGLEHVEELVHRA